MMDDKDYSSADRDHSGLMLLSESGRLSLSDITAATLGNLADDTQWTEAVLSQYNVTDADVGHNQSSEHFVTKANSDTDGAISTIPSNAAFNSTSRTHWIKHESEIVSKIRINGDRPALGSVASPPQLNAKRGDVIVDTHVLRPWECSNETTTTVSGANQPPSYHESVKRKWLGNDLHGNALGVTKRPRFEADPTPNPAYQTRLPLLNNQFLSKSHVNETWAVSSEKSVSNKSSGNDVIVGQFLTSLQQASKPIVAPQTKLLAAKTEPMIFNENSRVTYISTTDPSKTLHSEFGGHYVAHDNNIFPVRDISYGNTPFTSAQAKTCHREVLRPVPVSSVYTSNTPWTMAQRTNAGSVRNQNVNPNLLSVPNANSSLSGIMRQANTVHPNKIQSAMLPFIVPMSPNENQLHTASIVPSMKSESSVNGSHALHRGVISSDAVVKVEPVTPIGKRRASLYESSPATESRFSESLSSLLGSPPPDSPLSKNPFFSDLQRLLSTECKKEIVPQTLFGVEPKNEKTPSKDNVFARERNLQERFNALQSSCPEEVRQLSGIFRYQSALIETERFRTLHESQYPGSYRDSVNSYYDDKLHKVMDRVEKSVELLEKSNKENRPKTKTAKPRPQLSRAAVQMMDKWYNENREHPYPDSTTIEVMAYSGNINVEQVKKWFANKRNRNQNTRTLTEIAIQKRKLGQLVTRQDPVQ